MSIARLKEREGSIQGAKEIYDELYRKNPKDAQLCHRLAVVSMELAEFDKAAAYFQEAMQREPHNSEFIADFGYAHYLQGDLAGAEKLLRQALKEDPQNKRAINNLALIVGLQGRTDESYALFRDVVSDAEAHANVAFIHVQRGEGLQATQHYSRALSLDPKLKSAGEAMLQIAQLQEKYQSIAKQEHGDKAQDTQALAQNQGGGTRTRTVQAMPPFDDDIIPAAAISPTDANPFESPFDPPTESAHRDTPATATSVDSQGSRKSSAPSMSTEHPTESNSVSTVGQPPRDSAKSALSNASNVHTAADGEVLELVKSLNTNDALKLKQSIHQLGRMGNRAAAATDELRLKLQHPDEYVRIHAALALWRIAQDSEHTVPVVIRELKHQDAGIRSFAAAVLGEIGPDSADAVAALNAALVDNDGYVRLHVAEALGRFHAWNEKSTDVLLGCLKDQDRNVRWLATYSLAELAPQSDRAVIALAQTLRDDESRVRAGAAFALGEIGPAAVKAVVELENATKDPDTDVQSSATHALRRIQSANASVQ